ncbi:Carboxypeptidase D [Ascochyta rabiei]|uniref:Carboxypeptidase D n=1 Tax=Didymella rabiei TaxID=5454 RepID=UPI0022095461|nr:Carboxypeptidase D [Ascochyta rabiei]UPX19027.1 Carboxypeptidase D [Ascochyta rabiei]
MGRSSIHLILYFFLHFLSASAFVPEHLISDFPSKNSRGLRTIASNVAAGAWISYKETHICETTPGVRAFSGYIHLLSYLLDDFGGAAEYNASMFFWFFESRNDARNAPLSLYLGGGPGTTSLMGATSENGPCYINSDSNSTRLNPWSWNNNVSMLYIDQPVKVGFSYDSLVPSVLDLLTGNVTQAQGTEESNSISVIGILPNQEPSSAANTTTNAARVLWKFTQIWLQEFPEHKSSNDRISIWGNSYGGHWVPGAMAHFQAQNDKIPHNGTLDGVHARHLHLDTLGLTNGCVDAKIEGSYYPQYAFNNTYGLQTISEDVYRGALTNLTKEGGCYDLIERCRSLAIFELGQYGTNHTVNEACATATLYCFQYVQGAFTANSKRNPFDISRGSKSPLLIDYIIGYMNQDWVQKELGVPLNFSISSNVITQTYLGVTGDLVRVSIDKMNRVANSDIKIALIFGDRDYRCNWLGGEAVSLSLSYPAAPLFHDAGYQSILPVSNATSPVPSGSGSGLVRQHGSVSFSRVFNAGHAVGAYQPETVFHIFDRVMFDRDVATGNLSTAGSSNYSSKGSASSFDVKNQLPIDEGEPRCYTWDALNTCTEKQLELLRNGTAVVEDFFLTTS